MYQKPLSEVALITSPSSSLFFVASEVACSLGGVAKADH